MPTFKRILTIGSLSLLGVVTQSAYAMLPVCQSASSDADGDGYGWENNVSCIVVGLEDPNTGDQTNSSSNLPNCASASSDSDGDGFGWENNASCLVSASSGSSPIDSTDSSSTGHPACVSASSDPDGDGYGWENSTTCLVAPSTGNSDPVVNGPPPADPVVISQTVPDMVDIEAGCFDLGSPDDELNRDIHEGPQLNVCFGAFKAGRYEVTFAQYDAFAVATGRSLPDDAGFGRGNRPVINVDWNDATNYAAWLSAETGLNYRLPTEAEWEYIAKAGTVTAFNTGDSITSDQANFQGNQTYNGAPAGIFRNQTLPVGSFAPNNFGLYDVHGNIQEWTCSEFLGDYRSMQTPQECSNSTTGRRVLRGGTWRAVHRIIRSSRRNNLRVDFYDLESIGFRVVQQ